jgi:membrane protein DedA with SNARE-associated domain
MKPQDLDRAERWFDERGQRAVLIGRFVPVVRSLVSIPAGLSGMAPVRFTLYTALGSLVWNAALVILGFTAYQHVDEVADALGYLTYAIVAVLAVATTAFIWRRRVRDAR